MRFGSECYGPETCSPIHGYIPGLEISLVSCPLGWGRRAQALDF